MSLGDVGDFANLDVASLQEYLPGVRFPTEKEQVAATAERNGAPQDLVEKIRNVSRDRRTSSRNAVGPKVSELPNQANDGPPYGRSEV